MAKIVNYVNIVSTQYGYRTEQSAAQLKRAVSIAAKQRREARKGKPLTASIFERKEAKKGAKHDH